MPINRRALPWMVIARDVLCRVRIENPPEIKKYIHTHSRAIPVGTMLRKTNKFQLAIHAQVANGAPFFLQIENDRLTNSYFAHLNFTRNEGDLNSIRSYCGGIKMKIYATIVFNYFPPFEI